MNSPRRSKSDAAKQRPHLRVCVCGNEYTSRYRGRVLYCPRCRRVPECREWDHFHRIATVLCGPDANLKSSLNGEYQLSLR